MVNGNHNGKSPAMKWPLASDFSMMLQNPQVAFRDPRLKQIIIDRDERNQPRGLAGSFANVYRGTLPNGQGTVAVRVFTSGAPERRERYQFISDHVGHRHLNSLVGFNYTDDGIRSTDGKWYPLMTMEWVSGQTLYSWLREKCFEKSRQELARVSLLWVDTIKELIAAKIAHGDLQHGNVMVTADGKLKLVDYDCMCVPKLVGRRNLEIGVKPYQHPGRTEDTRLSLQLDNFSALFILVALKALAAAPDLWIKFVEQPQYDKLLFREEDFQDPRRSQLLEILRRSPDVEVQRLSRELVELSHASIDQVPALPDLLFSFATVESLLDQRDFDAAVELLTRGRKKVSDAPPKLQPRIREAEQRIECRCKLESAVESGDEQAMLRLYSPKLLDDYPKAHSSVAVARQAPQVIPLLGMLQSIVQAAKWRELVQIWDANQALLSGRKSTERRALEVNLWRSRNLAYDELLKLITPPIRDGALIEGAWDRLVQLGGHPEAESQRQRIEGLIQRQRAWIAFQQVPQTACEMTDIALVRAWNESLFAGWELAERARTRVVQAQSRLKLISQLRQQIGLELSLNGEETLVRMATNIPHEYQYDLQSRIELARQRIVGAKKLKQAVEAIAPSDVAIGAAWRPFSKLNAEIILSNATLSRIKLAMKRAPVLRALKQIPPNYPPRQGDTYDPQLLAVWEDTLLADCHDADLWRKNHQLAARRKLILAELHTAIDKGDRFRIADLAVDAALHDYPLARGLDHVVRQALDDVRATRSMLSALQSDQQTMFHTLFDVRVIRHFSSQFEPYHGKLREWIQGKVLSAEYLGLALPTGQQPLVWDVDEHAATHCKVRWNWPNLRFSDQCLLAILPQSPVSGIEFTMISRYDHFRVDRKSYEEAGGCRNIMVTSDCQDSYVIVAALLDLGFDKFISEPVILGRLDPLDRIAGQGYQEGTRS